MSVFNIRRVWANSIIFNTNVLSYSVLTTDTILFADVSFANGIIVLPSFANSAKAYTLKRIDTSNNVLTVTTDDANCLIDGATSINLVHSFDAMSCIMGNDDNYYIINRVINNV